jgi:hypothetical protein
MFEYVIKVTQSVCLDGLDGDADLINELHLVIELSNLFLNVGALCLHVCEHFIHLLDSGIELFLEFSIVAGLCLTEAELLLLLLVLELALQVALCVTH